MNSEALERLQQTVDRVEGALGDGRPWLMGDRVTIADACLLPTVDRAADLGLNGMWEKSHPNVAAWYQRYMSRPAYGQTYYHGTRLTEIFGAAE